MRVSILHKVTAAITLLSVCVAPALAQGYHYNYGGTRVVNQSQTGLMHNESTYIPTGSINPTAKGQITGGVNQIANPLLPKVPWGAHINTPGDNFYMGGAPDRKKATMPEYMYPQIQAAKRAEMERRRKAAEAAKKKREEVYYPGQNGASATYADANVTTQYNANGAASYSNNSGQKRGY
jgi:hypothetical protein